MKRIWIRRTVLPDHESAHHDAAKIKPDEAKPPHAVRNWNRFDGKPLSAAREIFLRMVNLRARFRLSEILHHHPADFYLIQNLERVSDEIVK